jgi:hypothetical protein
MKLELLCLGYDVRREPMRPPEVRVNFIIKTETRAIEEIAEAMKRLELYLAGEINLVRSDGSQRCFYCGVKQTDDAQVCSQCGAPL